MKRLWSLFHGLRGKLTLTYTFVTVLALLALEILVISAVLLLSSVLDLDKSNYLTDVVYTLYPQANDYLQPGQEDLAGLQTWLEQVYESGYASYEPVSTFDSPAAEIVQGEPMYVISPEKIVLAQVPAARPERNNQPYIPPDIPRSSHVLERALAGNSIALQLAVTTPSSDYFMAVPVKQEGIDSPVVGVILLTIHPSPPMLLQIWPVLLGWVLLTGVLLLMAVIPFGTLFGFIMSRGLTHRLGDLTRAADAWSEGNFRLLPVDRSKDEIGYLSVRMRNMAERVQNLLATQQQLALVEERNRLARELHDTVKQQTFATLMQVRAARNILASDPAAAGKYLEAAEDLIKTSQQDLGSIIAELRPAALEGQGLAGALRESLSAWSRNTRIPTTFNVLNECALPFEVEQALYRVAQEALSNVARHSHASAVTVRLDYQPGQVSLAIQDNGIGFHPSERAGIGYGLQSMQERITAVNGQLLVESESGSGTKLVAIAPVAVDKDNK